MKELDEVANDVVKELCRLFPEGCDLSEITIAIAELLYDDIILIERNLRFVGVEDFSNLITYIKTRSDGVNNYEYASEKVVLLFARIIAELRYLGIQLRDIWEETERKIIENDILGKSLVKSISSVNKKIFEMYKSQYFTQIMNSVEEKEKRVEELENKLDILSGELKKLLKGYNFVGLHEGFSKIYKAKKTEIRRSMMSMIFLGFTLIAIPMFMFFTEGGKSFKEVPYQLYLFLFTTTILLVYFFRLVANTYYSTKAQALQIELRMTLCQFVQNYVEYVEDQKSDGREILRKFEDVVFSPILFEGKDIPSTYDGLEVITKLVETVKKK